MFYINPLTRIKMRAILWIVMNFVFGACLVNGYFTQTEWQLNIFKFIVWVNFISSALVFYSKETRKRLMERGSGMHYVVRATFDLTMIGFLAAIGWFWFAVMCLLNAVFEYSIFNDKDIVKKL